MMSKKDRILDALQTEAVEAFEMTREESTEAIKRLGLVYDPSHHATPGPWEAEYVVVWGPDDSPVALASTNRAEREANARLLAAAPKMYEALEALLASIADTYGMHEDVPSGCSAYDCLPVGFLWNFRRAEDALAAARGEEGK